MKNGIYLREECDMHIEEEVVEFTANLNLIEVVGDVVILRDLDASHTYGGRIKVIPKDEFLKEANENGDYLQYLGTI